MSGTTTDSDNNNFTPEQNKRWDEVEAAEERNQNRQNSDGARQLEWSDEQKFAPYFSDANKKIDELVSDARQKKCNIDNELDKSIKEVVQNLAGTLKARGFPVNRIANEIVHQLKGRASRSWILEILSDEYKDKVHQENARKPKGKVAPVAEQSEDNGKGTEQHKQDMTHGDKVAPVAERKKQIMVGVGGHETSGDLQGGNEISGNLPGEHEISGNLPDEQTKESGSGDLPSEQGIDTTENSAANGSPPQHLRILIDGDELSDKMSELHDKGIKNFWLCGRIENHKLLDMVLEREVQ